MRSCSDKPKGHHTMSSGSSGSSTTVPVPSRSIFDFIRRIVAVYMYFKEGISLELLMLS